MSILNSLTKLITPELISGASKVLGEDGSKVKTALMGMIPGLLGAFLQKGNSSGIEGLLKKAAGLTDLTSDLPALFSGDSTGIGGGLIKTLLGSSESTFISGIAKQSGVSEEGAGKLLTGAGSLVAATLGSKLASGSNGMSGLLKSLEGEKSAIMSALPSGVSKLACLKDHSTGGSSSISGGSSLKSGGGNWWKWLLGLLVVAVLGYFVFKQCSSCSNKEQAGIVATNLVEADLNATTATGDKDFTLGCVINADCKCVNCKCEDKCTGTCAKCDITIGEVKPDINRVPRPTAKIILTSGVKLDAFDKGAEVNMLNAIEKTDFSAVANNAVLDDSWFIFDNVDFQGEGATLVADSNTQLENIAEILKNHPHAKIKINAHAKSGDNKGRKLALDQADAIKVKLVHAGVDAQSIDVKELSEELGIDVADDAILKKKVNDRRVTYQLKKK